MNSVIQYWKGRLEDICPFYNRKYLDDDAYSKYETLQRSSWPDFVSQRALYADYCEWFSATVTAKINVEAYLPHELPSPVHAKDFNAQVRPFLGLGRKSLTTNKRVTVPRNYQGSWFREQKFQRFYRLGKWQDHAAEYTRTTGGVINLASARNHDLTNAAKHESVSLSGHN